MKVLLRYFKQSGKWYSDSEYETTVCDYYSIISEVKTMRASGTLPGLTENGGKEFIIEVNPRQNDYCIPHLIFP